MDGYKQMELEYAIENMKKLSPYFVDISKEMAKITKSYYDGLINQGFMHDDAVKMSVKYTLGISQGKVGD
ncbi:hypothetical protein JCM19037_1404 [Geomicrobium sp. JCM 19037]|uniref:hypothetical protein n=1 Tax=Geomicrobium sp. JCM 19037 TaxID=1460634 RepID=UPI00045F4D4F|nr:hypothetical protein [Geomicrobium sp. JCM 19037]GAK03111.1 hypothetical protein JCM19037_1404 [Geomicrobium sp. JCM 19037]